MDLGENDIFHGLGEIYPGDHGAECAGDRVDVDVLEAHGAANLAGTAERAQSTTQARPATENFQATLRFPARIPMPRSSAVEGSGTTGRVSPSQ